MSPHRGLISARKYRRDSLAILREIRDLLKVDNFKEIPSKIRLIAKENNKLKGKLEGICSEFSNKKIGLMKIRKIGKIKTTKKGVLYFNKKHIGKMVIVWEKPRR